MTSPERQLELVHFLEALSAQLKRTGDVEKMLRYTLRVAREFLHAKHGCIFLVPSGRSRAEILICIPDEHSLDLDRLIDLLGGEQVPSPPDHLLAPVLRHGHPWAGLALVGNGKAFESGSSRELSRIASVVSAAVDRSDLDRMLVVRDRIERKTLLQLPPKDLYYQILHGLRSLTPSDHSSALFLLEDRRDTLVLAAEQIYWTKGKSRHINLRLPIAKDVRDLLESGVVHGFDRSGETWQEWDGGPASCLAELLDYNRGEDLDHGGPREAAMVCAPLSTRDGVLGLLKLGALGAGDFRPHDGLLIEQFRFHAAIAIQNARRTEAFRTRMIEAERRNAMGGLARGVSHDVNNALGSMLPLVQQMQADVETGTMDPQTLRADLEQIHSSLQVARRIFSGMLSFARRAAGEGHCAQVGRALEGVLDILRDGIERRGVKISSEIPADLPPVGGEQGQVEQLLLNLLTNARDAMEEGGHLTI